MQGSVYKGMIPCFSVHLQKTIRRGVATIGKYDGKHPQLTCGTESGKVFLHNPLSSEQPISFLNINREVVALESGKFNPKSQGEQLFVGTTNNLLCFDVEKNSDLFYLDISDGLGAMIFSSKFCSTPVILIGSDCNISGYDFEGNEIYWNSSGGFVTCMMVSETGELYAGADDRNIYIYKGEELIKEITESNVPRFIVDMGDGWFGFSLDDGAYGMYKGHEKVWKKKSKRKITSLFAFDLNCSGTKELIIGTETGRMIVRKREEGKQLYAERLKSEITVLLKSDYKMNGKDLLIVCCNDGNVRGFLNEQVERYIESNNSRFDSEIEELKKKRDKLEYEINSIEKNLENVKSGNHDPSLISHDTQVKCKLKPNVQDLCVEIIFQSDKSSVIKLAHIHAEHIFKGNETERLYYAQRPGEVLKIGLRPEKDIEVTVKAKVLVGHLMGNSFHVFTLQYNMPKFSMYTPVRQFPGEQPVSYVSFKLKERLNRLAIWLNTSFNIVYKHDAKEIVNVKFTSLRNGKPLQLLYQNGKMLIRVDSLETAGDLVQDLCQKLNLKDLESYAEFPKEEEECVTLLKNVNEFSKNRLIFTTEMAETSQQLKNLIIFSENDRIMKNISQMRQKYTQIYDMNKDLLVEYKKRETNQNRFKASLKRVNELIQLSSRVRFGSKKKEVVSQIRSLIQKKNFDAIVKIMRFGGLENGN